MRKIIFLSMLTLAACSSKTAGTNPAGVKTLIVASQPRPYVVKQLANGLKIYFVKDNTLPRVSLQALVKVGSVDELAGYEGLNSLTADLLDQGTTKRNAEQLAEGFNGIGTEFSGSAGSDGTVMGASALTPQADELLDLFADVMLNPVFNKKEIARAKSQVLSMLKRRLDNPGSVIARSFSEYMFGDNPYSRDENGTEASVEKIDRADLIRHFLAYYRPNNTLLAVTGRYSPEFEQKVIDVFSKWPDHPLKETEMKPLPPIEHLSARLVTKSELVQTQIRFGAIATKRSDPDYLKLRLAGEALGGSFASRLMAKIRNELGLTYSISSSVDARKNAGLFAISTFTRNDSVGKTIDEVLKLYREFAAKGITETELALAKAQLVGQYPRSFETADGMALQLLSVDFYGLPVNYLEEFPKIIDRITLSQVNQAIKDHLKPDQIKIVIYGDQKAIGDQLKPWNVEVVQPK